MLRSRVVQVNGPARTEKEPSPAAELKGIRGYPSAAEVTMNLRDLECFFAVAGELHFGAAAQQLHMSPSAVTEAVRRLERGVGGALLVRTTRHVELTPLGAEFVEHVRPVYHALRDAYEDCRRIATRSPGRFVLSYTKEYEERVFAVVRGLAKLVPHVAIEISELGTAAQIEALRRHRIDAGIVWEVPADPPFARWVLDRCGYTALMLNEHPLANETELSLTQLAAEPLVLTPRDLNPHLFDRVLDAFIHVGLTPKLMPAAFGNLSTQVLTGRGIGLLPTLAVPEPRLSGVRYIPLGPGGPVVARALVWLRDQPWAHLADLIECLNRPAHVREPDQVLVGG
jgi:DNA-binding transcriptional LysR family regulator